MDDGKRPCGAGVVSCLGEALSKGGVWGGKGSALPSIGGLADDGKRLRGTRSVSGPFLFCRIIIFTGRARNTRFRIARDRALADSLAFPRSVETLMRKLGNLAF